MKIIQFLQRYFWDLPKIITFNFRHFPFNVAIKLPVLLHKTELMGGASL